MSLDDDVRRLREFRRSLAEPGPGRLAEGRRRLLTMIEGPVELPRRRRRWVPVLAAASAVLVVTVGAVLVLGGAPLPVGLPFGAGPRWPEGTGTESAPDKPDQAEHVSAVQLLEQLARTAEQQPGPLVVPSGKLLYVRSSSLPDGMAPTLSTDYLHEMWLEQPGCIPLMIRRQDGTSGFTMPDPTNPRDNWPAELDRTRAQFAADGPSLRFPTPEFLAGLPTDPAQLYLVLGDLVQPSRGAWSTEHAIADQVRGLFNTAGPLIPPAQKAAIYRVLARLGSVAATGTPQTLAGRTVVGVAQLERGGRDQLLFDLTTGDLVGSGGESSASFFAIWQHSLVSSVGEVPA